MPNVDITTVLAIIIPVILAFVARTLSGIIAQEHWSDSVNEGIADGFVIVAVVIDGVAMTRIGNGLGLIVAVPGGILTAYLAKSLGTLDKWSSFLQGNFLTVKGDHVELDDPVSGASLIQLNVPQPPQPIVLPNTSKPAGTANIVPPQITLPTRLPSGDTTKPTE